MEQNYKEFGVSVKAVVINNEGKILICKSERGIWDLPGGRMNEGETIAETLSREVKEELGVECELIDERPLFAWNGLSDDGEPKVSIGFRTKLSSLNFKPSNENTQSAFLSAKELGNIRLQNTITNLKTWLSS